MRITDSPITEPVSLDQVKDIMGYATGSHVDDDLILRTITEMRSLIEEHTGLLVVNRTLTVYTDRNKVRIPFRPVTGITSITCTVEGTETSVETFYVWNADDDPVVTFLAPEGATDFEIVLTAGLDATPQTLKGAIIDLCKARLERNPIEPVMEEIQKRCYIYFREEI